MITDAQYDNIAAALHKAGKSPSKAREIIIANDYAIKINGELFKDVYLKAVLKRLHVLSENEKFSEVPNFEI